MRFVVRASLGVVVATVMSGCANGEDDPSGGPAKTGVDPDAGSGGSGGAGATGGTAGTAGASGGAAGAAPLSCQAPLADCDADAANGCEVDTSADFQHCGSCAHDCLGATCNQGKCDAYTLGELSGSVAFSVDPGHWVFACSSLLGTEPDAADLTRMSVTGSVPTLIFNPVSAEMFCTDLAVHEGRVYWATNNATLRSMLIEDPTSPVLEYPKAVDPTTFSITDGHVVWVSDAKLKRAPLIGGNVQTLASTEPCTFASAPLFQGKDVYWTCFEGDGQDPGRIERYADSTGSVEVLAANQQGAANPLLTTTHVYWSVGPNKQRKLVRRALGGGQVEDVYDVGSVADSVVRDGKLYVTLQEGKLVESALDGSGALVLVDRSGSPCSFGACTHNFNRLESVAEGLYFIDSALPDGQLSLPFTTFYRVAP
jgi:hypothetical protein